MPIHRLLENQAFTPDEIAVLVGAFEAALGRLGLADREDPMTEIIELAQQGVRGSERLCEQTVQAITN